MTNQHNPNRRESAGHRYRADIDGLRAVAVVPVIFYHFKISPFTGGYVGVDIFFVISGFLITSLIYTEIRENRFSILTFYERRVRRILPALFTVLAGTTLLSLIILFPSDLKRYMSTLIASVLFSSNLKFWLEAGYFDPGAEVKPLLHTWSLAVEEQFYLIYPAILFSMRRASKSLLMFIVVLILIGSFAISVWGVWHAPSSTFYLLPARMWELMLGAVLALGAFPVVRRPILANLLAALGGTLIAYSVFAFNHDTAFPGPAALFPCVGAALLIYSGTSGTPLINNFLSKRVCVSIGLISYSLYLWHWPLYVYSSYVATNVLSMPVKIGLILLSFLMAWLSWRFVERPFRGRNALVPRRRLFSLSAVATVCALAVGAGGIALKGLPQRYNGEIRTLLSASGQHQSRHEECFNLPLAAVRAGRLCKVGSVEMQPSFLVWGDSHADSVFPAIDAAAKAHRRAGLFAGNAACLPLLDVERAELPGVKCREFNEAVATIARSPEIEQVILVGRWARNAEGSTFGLEQGITALIVDNQSKERSLTENKAVFLRGLRRTVDMLATSNKQIVLLGPIPEIGQKVPHALAKARFFGGDPKLNPTRKAFIERQKFVLSVFTEMKRHYPVTILYPDTVLCPDQKCALELKGKPLYMDEHHLTVFGASQLQPLFEQVL